MRKGTAPELVEMFIDGRDVSGQKYFPVHDPGKQSDVVARVACGTPLDVDLAVRAARKAHPLWSRTSASERLKLLGQAAALFDKPETVEVETLTRENGATLLEAQMDLSRGSDVFRNLLELGSEFLLPEVLESSDHWLSIEKVSIGVAALIVPWNSPMVLTMAKLAPALVTGNTVVVKPSIYAPVTVSRRLKLIAALLPPGVLNVVEGDVDVGSALVTHPNVGKISFTGSVEAGRQILAEAARSIKRTTLELGGNDPAIILDDANIDSLMDSLCRGIFTRAGQICFAVKRVYVPEAMYDEFFDAMCAVADGYSVGHGLDPAATFGPLINERQRQRVAEMIERARKDRATIRELGRKVDPRTWDEGHYMLPHVVRDIRPGSELETTEQFAPIIPLIPYRTVGQAIDLANASEFGLCSSVWSSDVDRAIDVARKIEAGSTFINSHNLWSLSLDMPFGGVKQSGLGRERTMSGLSEYVEMHSIRRPKKENERGVNASA